MARADRPEIAEVRGLARVARAEHQLARSKVAPRVLVSIGPDLNTAVKPFFWGAFFMASLEIPIFDRQKGPRAEAAVKSRELEAQDAAARDIITREVAIAVAHAAYARAELDRYIEVFLPAAWAQLDALRTGSANADDAARFLARIRSYESLTSSIVGHADARLAWHHAVADVDLAIGRVADSQ